MLAAAANVSFFQFFFAVGPALFALSILSLFIAKQRHDGRQLKILLLFSLAALVLASLVFGCGGNTLNHHWAYPALLLVFVAAAYSCESESALPSIIFVVGCAFNTLILLLNLLYPSGNTLSLHVSEQYFYGPLFASICCALVFLYLLLSSGDSDESFSN